MHFLKDHDRSTNLPSGKQITVHVAQLVFCGRNSGTMHRLLVAAIGIAASAHERLQWAGPYSARSSKLTPSAFAKARRVVTEPCLRPVSISATVTRFTLAFSARAACVIPRRSR